MKAVLSAICLYFALLPGSVSWAQTLTILEEFDYGTLVVLNNSAQRSFTIQPNNNLTYNTNHFNVVSAGTRARIRINGGPANTSYTVLVSATPVLQNGVGPQYFDIITPVVRPIGLSTNGAGTDIFRIGTTLRTSGNGLGYSGSFSGAVDVTVNF